MSSYNRNQLLALRNSTLVASSTVASQIPSELLQLCQSTSTNEKNVKPVTTYSRSQLLRIRDQQQQLEMNDFTSEASSLPPAASTIPSELRRASRFRCDSNCLNQEVHETKQILKYSRLELLRYRAAASSQTCAAQYIHAMQATETKAPEILRHLGH